MEDWFKGGEVEEEVLSVKNREEKRKGLELRQWSFSEISGWSTDYEKVKERIETSFWTLARGTISQTLGHFLFSTCLIFNIG